MRLIIDLELEASDLLLLGKVFGETNVSKEWIEQRFEQYQERGAKKQRRHDLDEKAKEVSESLFQQLKDTMEEDVKAYNLRFSIPDCQCTLHSMKDSFQVTRSGGYQSLSVQHTRKTTVIHYTVTTRKAASSEPKTQKGYIEVKPDYDSGEIGYRFKDQLYLSADAISEKLLDFVFCGPQDFES